MDRFLINGGRRLEGDLPVGGAKNAALPILAATLLSAEPQQITNVPDVRDVQTIRRLLAQMGAVFSGDTVRVEKIERCEAPYEMVKTMRASILVLGPLLARCGEAHVSLPGGCAIGARPVGLHLDALKKMGAEVRIEHGIIHAKCERLTGATIHFDQTTVTGTENIMMAATLAHGTTILNQAACEPEVVDLARFLIECGAKISGAGSERIVIEGVESLGGATHRVIPDRIEAATFLIAGAMVGRDLFIRDAQVDHLTAVLGPLRATGADLVVETGGIRVRGKGRRGRPVDFSTAPYPAFPTDVGPQMMALLSVADGVSLFDETIFEGRFNHVPELLRMGANITIDGMRAKIAGVQNLLGAQVMAPDLRAGVALVLAGLAAEGTTEISRVYHVDRGYERIDEKLAAVGADIRRVAA